MYLKVNVKVNDDKLYKCTMLDCTTGIFSSALCTLLTVLWYLLIGDARDGSSENKAEGLLLNYGISPLETPQGEIKSFYSQLYL